MASSGRLSRMVRFTQRGQLRAYVDGSFDWLCGLFSLPGRASVSDVRGPRAPSQEPVLFGQVSPLFSSVSDVRGPRALSQEPVLFGQVSPLFFNTALGGEMSETRVRGSSSVAALSAYFKDELNYMDKQVEQEVYGTW